MRRPLIAIALFTIATVSCGKSDNKPLINPDFENGILEGWTIEGNSFTEKGITDLEYFWDDPAKKFNQEGGYHYYGYLAAPENATGTLKSSPFTLTGSGRISFLLGAGKDTNRVYVGIHDAKTDEELFRVKNRKFKDPEQSNNYSRYIIDASRYLGRDIYIKLVDKDDDGDFGFINFDDLRIEK